MGMKHFKILFAGILILVLPIYSLVSAAVDPNIYLPIVMKGIPPIETLVPSPTATSKPSTTPPPHNTGNITITTIFYDGTGQNEPDEYVQIRNDDTFSIQLQNWTLRDQANHTFYFPNFIMIPGQVCRVYTNQVHPEWCGFSYGSGTAIWNNTGDCAYLRDSAAALVDQYCY
jgi:hypothetical protein